MSEYVQRGDTVFVEESGELVVNYGQGKKADHIQVVEGEALSFPTLVRLEGVAVTVYRKRLERALAKVRPRAQAVRTCSMTYATLEVGNTMDPVIAQIEKRMADRSRLVTDRLKAAKERLTS